MPAAAHQSSSVPREDDDSSIQVTSFATALSLSSLDWLRASRLLLPRSGLERSDFVRWAHKQSNYVRFPVAVGRTADIKCIVINGYTAQQGS